MVRYQRRSKHRFSISDLDGKVVFTIESQVWYDWYSIQHHI